MKRISRYVLVVFVLASMLLGACTGAPGTGGGSKVEAIPVAYIGMIEGINGNQWTVNGQTVTVDPSVVHDGPFNVGDTVKVEVDVNPDGTLTVTRVELPSSTDLSQLPSLGDDNSNGNSNDDNSNDVNANDVNSNDDNSNSVNSNDDNSNSVNSNGDNSNSVNSNDDNSNSVNSNDDNSNGNTNDDNSNAGNSNDDSSNGNGGGNDNGGGGGNDNGGGGGGSNDSGGGGGNDNGGNSNS